MSQRAHQKEIQISGEFYFMLFSRFTIRVFRINEEDRDRRVDRDDEFSDSEDEGEGGRRNKDDFKLKGQTKSKSSNCNSLFSELIVK